MSTPSHLFFGGLSTRSFLKPSPTTGFVEAFSDRNEAVNKAIELRLREKWPSAKVSRPTFNELVLDVDEGEELTFNYFGTIHIFIADIAVETKDKWAQVDTTSAWVTKNTVYSILSMEKTRIRTLLPNATVTIRQQGFPETVNFTTKMSKAA